MSDKKTPGPEHVLPPEQRKASDDSENKPGRGFTAVLLACFFMIGWAVVVAKQRGAEGRTEAQVLAEARAASGEAAPKATRGEQSFPSDLQDPNFTASLYRITRELHGPISHCLETAWPDAPTSALIRITTGPLGDMETGAVAGAPAAAEECLVMVLSKAHYPRNADSVSDLRLDPSGASIEDIGGVTETVPTGKPGRPRRDYLPSKPGEYTNAPEGEYSGDGGEYSGDGGGEGE